MLRNNLIPIIKKVAKTQVANHTRSIASTSKLLINEQNTSSEKTTNSINQDNSNPHNSDNSTHFGFKDVPEALKESLG